MSRRFIATLAISVIIAGATLATAMADGNPTVVCESDAVVILRSGTALPAIDVDDESLDAGDSVVETFVAENGLAVATDG